MLALDLMLGAMLDELEASGELGNTVIVPGDHGIPGIPVGRRTAMTLRRVCRYWSDGPKVFLLADE